MYQNKKVGLAHFIGRYRLARYRLAQARAAVGELGKATEEAVTALEHAMPAPKR